MLKTLDITSFALLHQLSLELEPGLNLITGETGAGKSILVDALGFVLGGKAGADVVSAGAEACRVVALFEVARGQQARLQALLEERGLPACLDGELALKRELSLSGRSRCWVNSEPAPLTALAAVGDLLVDFQGQHEHQSLLKPQEQGLLLDLYSQAEGECQAVAGAWQAWQGALERLRALDMDATERERRQELLRFQVEELSSAGVKAGERESLLRERALLQSALRRGQAASSALAALDGGDEGAGGAVPGLATALKSLKELAALDPAAEPLAARLESLSIEADDLARSLARAASAIEDDPGRLEAVEARLALLEALLHKHKRDEAGLLAFLDEAQAQLNDLVDVEASRQALGREIAAAEQAWGRAALALSAKRRAGAAALAKKVMERLRRLGMEKAAFSVALPAQAPGPRGGEAAELMLAANPGEGAKPLSKVASGGELSRLMLAIKAALSDLDPADTLVFDEVDAGISGKVAEEVGKELARLASRRQALCVTHLPQIACLPATHLQVSKQVKAGRTSTRVERLDEGGRVEALAALLGGAQATESARAHARQLMAAALATAGAA